MLGMVLGRSSKKYFSSADYSTSRTDAGLIRGSCRSSSSGGGGT